MSAGSGRPSVSVVVPFLGGAAEAEAVAQRLLALERQPGDQLMIVDNSPHPVARGMEGVEVIRAERLASSYHARNAGARAASCEWVLFVDSDCVPPPSLLADLLASRPAPRCGIVAGEVVAARGQDALTARYETERGHLSVEQHLHMGPSPAGVTANLLVRRATWEELGGFEEVRSGADVEFCYRAAEAGWSLEYVPSARVEHLHTTTVRSLLRKARRYGPGQAWVNRRFPGAAPRPDVARQLVRAAGGSLVWLVRLKPIHAAFKALDALWAIAYAIGYRFGSNEATPITASDPG